MLVKLRNAQRKKHEVYEGFTGPGERSRSFPFLRTNEEGKTRGGLPAGIGVTCLLKQGRDAPRAGEQTKVINFCQSEDKTSL